jgi:hypothetical protein
LVCSPERLKAASERQIFTSIPDSKMLYNTGKNIETLLKISLSKNAEKGKDRKKIQCSVSL